MRRQPGSSIDRYTIERFLGEGGMGELYVAFDPRLRRRVALKILRANTSAIATTERLLREARAVASFKHPNVVAIHDVLDVGDHACLVMEFVEGRTLRHAVGDGSVSIDRKLRYLVSIARALDAAHKAGLIHRDLKPDNVMVQNDDSVKVLDFGIAKRIDTPIEKPTTADEETPESIRTDEGKVVGTPAYMAPEQLAGWKIDAGADQFAWGVVAVELLTGIRQAPMSPAIATQSLEGVPRAVSLVIVRSLARLSVDRFRSMSDLADALDPTTKTTASEGLRENALAHEKTTVDHLAPTTGATVLPIATRKRSRALWLGAALGATALVAGGSFYFARHELPAAPPTRSDACLARELPVTTRFAASSITSMTDTQRPGGVEIAILGGDDEDQKIFLASIDANAVHVRSMIASDNPLERFRPNSVYIVHGRSGMEYWLEGRQSTVDGMATVLFGRALADDARAGISRLEMPGGHCTVFGLGVTSVAGRLLSFALCAEGPGVWELRVFGSGIQGEILRRSEAAEAPQGPFVVSSGVRAHVAIVENGDILHGWYPSIPPQSDGAIPTADPAPLKLAPNAGSPGMLADGDKVHFIWFDRMGGMLHHALVSESETRTDEASLSTSDGTRPAFITTQRGFVVAWAHADRLYAGCGRAMADVVRSSAQISEKGVSAGPFIASNGDKEPVVAWLMRERGGMAIRRALVTCP